MMKIYQTGVLLRTSLREFKLLKNNRLVARACLAANRLTKNVEQKEIAGERAPPQDEEKKGQPNLKNPGGTASGFGYLLYKNHGNIQGMPTHHHTHKQNAEKHKSDNFLQPGLHKDWRTWVVIGLMLAAIGIYVLTLDDSVQLGNATQPGVPAAVVPR